MYVPGSCFGDLFAAIALAQLTIQLQLRAVFLYRFLKIDRAMHIHHMGFPKTVSHCSQ